VTGIGAIPMGIIDKKWIKLTCTKCANAEVQSVSQKGSSYSADEWGSIDHFQSFNVKSIDRGMMDPEVVEAQCKKCGGLAEIDEQFGFNKPENY